MSFLAVGVFSVILAVIDVTMALAQTPYGVPVAPPQEPPTPSTVGQPPVTASTVTRGSAGGAALRFTPNIAISERYDSNVLYLPQAVHDYVTNIAPGGVLNYANDWIDTTTSVTLSSEIYALNPGLNYVGGSGRIYASLDNVVGRVIRGATLRVTNASMYIPTMPGFAAPETGNLIPPEFVRGMQVYRNNSFSNSIAADVGYAMTPRLSMNALYSYSIMRFLEDSTAEGTGTLFDTDAQSLTAGPQYALSPNDKIGMSLRYQKISFGSSFQGGVESPQQAMSGATIYGAALTWNSTPTRSLSFMLSPGASILSGSGEPQFTGTAQFQWNAEPTLLSLMYTRGLYPTFYFESTVMLSDMIIATGTYKLTDKWMLSANVNYSVNRAIGGGDAVRNFDSDGYGYGFGAMYELGPGTSISANYNYTEFSYQGEGSSLDMTRNAVTLQFRKEWR